MRFINILRLTILLLISNVNWGQFNIQTGYDFGVVKFPKLLNTDDYDLNNNVDFSRETNFNFLHRFNLIGEYKFPNNLVSSLNFGFDNYRNKYDHTTTETFEGGCIENTRIDEYYARVNTLRFEFSLGYTFKLSNKSSIVLKGNYALFIITNHKILKSKRTIIGENKCFGSTNIKSVSMIDFINLNHSYGNRVKTDWNQISLSTEYRHKFNDINLNIYSAFMPVFDPDFLAGTSLKNGGTLVFILGLRLSYTLQQKKQNNEK